MRMENLIVLKQKEIHLDPFLPKVVSRGTSMRKTQLAWSYPFPISSLHKILGVCPPLQYPHILWQPKFAFIIRFPLIYVIWCLSTSLSTTFLSLSVNSSEIILYTHPIRLIGLKSQLLGSINFRNQHHVCCIQTSFQSILGVRSTVFIMWSFRTPNMSEGNLLNTCCFVNCTQFNSFQYSLIVSSTS